MSICPCTQYLLFASISRCLGYHVVATPYFGLTTKYNFHVMKKQKLPFNVQYIRKLYIWSCFGFIMCLVLQKLMNGLHEQVIKSAVETEHSSPSSHFRCCTTAKPLNHTSIFTARTAKKMYEHCEMHLQGVHSCCFESFNLLSSLNFICFPVDGFGGCSLMTKRAVLLRPQTWQGVLDTCNLYLIRKIKIMFYVDCEKEG